MFRKEAIIFHEKPPTAGSNLGEPLLKWGAMTKTFKGFKLAIEPGEIKIGEIVGILRAKRHRKNDLCKNSCWT